MEDLLAKFMGNHDAVLSSCFCNLGSSRHHVHASQWVNTFYDHLLELCCHHCCHSNCSSSSSSTVPDLYRIWMLSSLAQNGHAMACPLVQRSDAQCGRSRGGWSCSQSGWIWLSLWVSWAGGGGSCAGSLWSRSLSNVSNVFFTLCNVTSLEAGVVIWSRLL